MKIKRPGWMAGGFFRPGWDWDLGGRKPTAKAVGDFQKIVCAGAAMPGQSMNELGINFFGKQF